MGESGSFGLRCVASIACVSKTALCGQVQGHSLHLKWSPTLITTFHAFDPIDLNNVNPNNFGNVVIRSPVLTLESATMRDRMQGPLRLRCAVPKNQINEKSVTIYVFFNVKHIQLK